MPSNERDPRRDPRPGDVLRSKHGIELIIRVVNGRVWWASTAMRNNQLFDLPLVEWLKYSKDDEVLYVAE